MKKILNLINRLLASKAFLCCGLVFLLLFSGAVTLKAHLSAEAVRKEDSQVIVAFAGIDESDDWCKANRKFYSEVFDNAENYKFKYSDAKGDSEKQKSQVKDFVFYKSDFIIINPISPDGWEDILKSAKETGSSVIFAGNPVDVEDESLYVQWIGSNFSNEGRSAAKWLEEHLGGDETEKTVNILTITGETGSTEQVGRSKGFELVAASKQNWVLTEGYGEGRAEFAKIAVASALENNDIPDVIVCQTDAMLSGIIEALDEAELTTGSGGDIILISYDSTKEAFKLMIEGKLNVSIEKTPDYGYAVKTVIKELLKDKDSVFSKTKYLNESVFLPETAKLDIIGRWY